MYVKLNKSEARTKLELQHTSDELEEALYSIQQLKVNKNLTANIHLSFSAFKYTLYEILRDGAARIALEDDDPDYNHDSTIFNVTGIKHIEGVSGNGDSETIFTVNLEYTDADIIEGF